MYCRLVSRLVGWLVGLPPGAPPARIPRPLRAGVDGRCAPPSRCAPTLSWHHHDGNATPRPRRDAPRRAEARRGARTWPRRCYRTCTARVLSSPGKRIRASPGKQRDGGKVGCLRAGREGRRRAATGPADATPLDAADATSGEEADRRDTIIKKMQEVSRGEPGDVIAMSLLIAEGRSQKQRYRPPLQTA
eukprot:SAG22_NODE_2879_length_2130_cov_2.531265_3_plen_190_part_00